MMSILTRLPNLLIWAILIPTFITLYGNVVHKDERNGEAIAFVNSLLNSGAACVKIDENQTITQVFGMDSEFQDAVGKNIHEVFTSRGYGDCMKNREQSGIFVYEKCQMNLREKSLQGSAQCYHAGGDLWCVFVPDSQMTKVK